MALGILVHYPVFSEPSRMCKPGGALGTYTLLLTYLTDARAVTTNAMA